MYMLYYNAPQLQLTGHMPPARTSGFLAYSTQEMSAHGKETVTKFQKRIWNINQRGLLLPKQFLWSICCLPWERKQDKDSIYELLSQQQLPQFAVTKKIM